MQRSRLAPAEALPTAATREPIAIRCRNLGKRFETLGRGDVWRVLFGDAPVADMGFQALTGINLDVPKGQFVGLLGRNGAGKSTLLRTLGGVFAPSMGLLRLDGSVSGVYALGVQAQLMTSGRRFAEGWLRLAGEPEGAIPQLLQDIETFAELAEYFDQPIRMYSTGMRARLFFGTVTAVRADVYLIDELLAVGDEYFTAKCWRRVREKIAKGTSGVFASHDWAAMLRLCSTAYVLERGRVVDSGSAADVVRRYVSTEAQVSGAARFASALCARIHGQAGKEATWSFPVELVETDTANFAMSIESLQGGGGWRHLVHLNPIRIGPGRGKWDVTVVISNLPLPAGQYYANLFLSAVKQGAVDGTVYDSRGWLTGNPVILEVDGPNCGGVAQLPMEWSFE